MGTLFITAFIFSDVIDGIMARMQERGGRWGNFLDSTLDRVADGALFAGVAVWFFTGGADTPIAVAAVVCLVLGMVVSYARAKAEALGFHANVGIAERAERLVSVLVVTGFTGLGLPSVVLFVTLCLLALASLVTVVQRIIAVHRQSLGEPEGTASREGRLSGRASCPAHAVTGIQPRRGGGLVLALPANGSGNPVCASCGICVPPAPRRGHLSTHRGFCVYT